ncbi:MAG: acetyl-CoA carboxylase carboxyl transferase subunit beta [Verrucomicrobia bacterium]|nr:acetyl-CoA carboxylase carboxyl transferase subunit beta [Verrucomicrobiota bacterium]
MGIFNKRSVADLGEKKKDMPEGLWIKCPSCGESLYEQALAKNLRVCSHCQHHFTLSAEERIALVADEGSFEEIDAKLDSVNPLGFKDYLGKVRAYQAKTGLTEAVITGRAKIDGQPVLLAIMDCAVIVFSASGGARMHEGILSLMQMAKTSGALARHSEAKLPYVSVLTHPTTGGVTASFATLGDIILAEPKCMIGFAGPRVVKETTHSDLPPGFQTAEFMMEHGLVDTIVPRAEMRSTLSRLLLYLLPKQAAA